jgi:hypothetical protein
MVALGADVVIHGRDVREQLVDLPAAWALLEHKERGDQTVAFRHPVPPHIDTIDLQAVVAQAAPSNVHEHVVAYLDPCHSSLTIISVSMSISLAILYLKIVKTRSLDRLDDEDEMKSEGVNGLVAKVRVMRCCSSPGL